jgi:hypothetical protein
MEISKDLGFRPIIFIRFNPDYYYIKEKQIESCCTTNQNGLCIIKKNKINEWNERLALLEHTIKYWINSDNVTNKTIEQIELFYDS